MKVISFSIWGNDHVFVRGAIENIHLAKMYYPEWRVRIYCRDDVTIENRQMFERAGAQVQVVIQTRGDWEGLFWRFYPIWDLEVTHTISRDCDSRLNPREACAVREWQASGKKFHTMRDHYQHIVPILGGMFGCTHWHELAKVLMQWDRFKRKGDDQEWLTTVVWPLVKQDVLAHDRYPVSTALEIEKVKFVYDPVKFFGEHLIKPFPEHEPLSASLHGDFVGSRVGTA